MLTLAAPRNGPAPLVPSSAAVSRALTGASASLGRSLDALELGGVLAIAAARLRFGGLGAGLECGLQLVTFPGAVSPRLTFSVRQPHTALDDDWQAVGELAVHGVDASCLEQDPSRRRCIRCRHVCSVSA